MKKIYTIILGPMLLAFVLAGFTSCVRSTLYDCVDSRGNVRLTVNLDIDAVSRSNASGGYTIDCAHVYVFDSNNTFVDSRQGGSYAPGGYEFFFNLDPGNYHFVAWTNQGEIYKINKTIEECEQNGHSLDELFFYLDHEPSSGVLTSDIPDLLHGIKKGEIIISDRNNHIDLLITPNTYTINIKVKGLPETPDVFDFTITDNNSHYTFDNNIIDQKDDFQHTRICRQVGGELNNSIKTLQITRERSPRFTFTNATTSEILYDHCLVETILNAYETASEPVDFDKIHTFDIVLTYDVNMSVTVSVNGWNYQPDNTDLE